MSTIDIKDPLPLGISEMKATISKKGLRLNLLIVPPEGIPDTLGGTEFDKLVALLEFSRVILAKAGAVERRKR